MEAAGPAAPGRHGPAPAGLVLVGVLAGLVGVLNATGGGGGDAAHAGAAPQTFFAVRDVGTGIVEVEVASGRVLDTLVDLGHGDPEGVAASGGLIDGVHLTADRRHLYYSRHTTDPGSVYRLPLPDGVPEQIADGYGASVSPDGRRLARIRRADLVIRDLTTSDEQVFTGMVGDLGGVQTAWANDSRHLAVEISGADVSVVAVVDTATGQATAPQPDGGLAVDYRVTSPRFRPSDGVLAVVCCHTGEIIEGDPPDSLDVVLHDPVTGTELRRWRLPVPARDIDWDRTGSQLLFTDGDRVRYSGGGRYTEVPEVRDVYAVAW